MIKKLLPTVSGFDESPTMPNATDFLNKINELVDVVNTIQKEREAERFEIQEWIGILGTVRKSVNKLETMAKNTNTVLKSLVKTKHEEPTDPYAEQRKWIGKACYFWDNNAQTKAFGWLEKIDQEGNEAPFMTNFGQWYDNCEPVKPDDDVIYKGE